MNLIKTKNFLLFTTLFLSVYSYSQVIWNEKSFSLTRDVGTLENMAGAVAIDFNQSGVFFRSEIIAPVGFTFNYGLKKYTSFCVSSRGFIKLGSQITTNNPAMDTTVICPLYSNTEWEASYKVTGSGPGLKLIIEFAGVMQPTGQPTSFQIWLFPAGKIQFIYQKLRGYYDYPDSRDYKIFCQAYILGKKAVASVKINANNSKPEVDYSDLAITSSNDSIYPNTRLTFQPDTVKPAKPSDISFSSIYPGCFTVNMTEGSDNESMVILELADSSTNFKIEKYFYPTNPEGKTMYSYEQAHTQPQWVYNYQLYVSNGMKNSDTLYGALETPMPFLSGILKIPGDYPTITALLQDAECKHIGPSLIMELQDNYSFADENTPLSFNKDLHNRFIRNITIRPADNASINMADSTVGPLIYIDSIKHIVFDGRAGGIGTNRALTLYQKNGRYPTIQFSNGSDSCILNYCNILKKDAGYSTGAIVIGPFDKNNSPLKTNVDALRITNNFVSADTNTVSNLITVKSLNPTQAANMLIDGNYFCRFRNTAVSLDGVGEGTVISNNHFFQPEPVKPIINGSCISAVNTGTITIDNNYFGGSTEKWGSGKMSLTLSNPYSIIKYQAANDTSKAFITNNKFGNITATYSSDGSPHLLEISHGTVLVEGNSFGTADSTGSLTYGGFMWPVRLNFGVRTIRNNLFSGLRANNDDVYGGNTSYVITSSSTDSLSISDNDIGGSDYTLANTSSYEINVIQVSGGIGSISIANNQIRGFNTKGNRLAAIVGGSGYPNMVINNLFIGNNSVHHLQSNGYVHGINFAVKFSAQTEISNNKIYSLKTTGTYMDYYGPKGNIYGITYTNISSSESKEGVDIFGNRIHSFESIRTDPRSVFTYDAINVECPLSRIYNNEIRLGINSKGYPVDAATGIYGISISPFESTGLNNHLHFIEHNSIYTGGKTLGGNFIKSYYNYQNVRDTNVVNISNNIFNLANLNDDVNPVTKPFMQLSGTKPVTANNLWYSETVSNLPSILASFQKSCNCSWSDTIGDPKFINPDGDSLNYNLRLGIGSKADSTGALSALGIETDIDGLKRNKYSPIDLGCYAATPSTSHQIYWSGTVSSAWENPANWVGGKLPDINTDVIVDSGLSHYPTVGSNAVCNSLTIKPGASFMVLAGYTLTIEH